MARLIPCLEIELVPSEVPNIGVFCPTFLKPEMWHVYRQVVGPRRVRIHVFAFKRENGDQFPFASIHLLERSGLRWARRIWYNQIVRSPQIAFPSEATAFERALGAFEPKLLHIYFGNNGVFWLPLLRRKTIPIIVSFHGADVTVGFNSDAGQRRLRQVFSAADLLLARSSSLQKSLVSAGCSPDKIRLQRTGIPTSDFGFAERSYPSNGGFQLLQACRFIEKKGLEVTLKAYAQFARKWPNSRLVLAGDGPLRKTLERLAQELGVQGRVTFTGFLTKEQLLRLYYNSHFFVHPSETTETGDREGIPNSLLEAMATGLCVITTQHGGIPEAIQHLENGILVAERDLEAVRDWMERLVQDWPLARRLARSAADTVAREFDSIKQIQRLESTYLDLVERDARIP